MKKNLYLTLRLNISTILVWSLIAGLGFNIRIANAETSGNSITGQYAQSLPETPKSVERHKFALLVGINKYSRKDNKTGEAWWDLHTKGDIELIAKELIERFDFKPEDIKILCDEDVEVAGKIIKADSANKPTHKNIVDTFRSFLNGQANEGDVIYFHFSGHGQQIPDDNVPSNPVVGDELDGMDETIIPIDYVSQTDGSKNIRDDEIGILLDELNQRKPSNITITLDSCFSGTGTRGGEGLVRGGPWKGKPIDPKSVKSEDEDFGDSVSHGRGGDGAPNYVFISAASPKQVAGETKEGGVDYGKFTWALSQAMEKANGNTTYRDLFEKITDIMTQKQATQTPQIEGFQKDKIVMAEGAKPPDPYLEVKFEKDVPILQAGTLQGMTVGSKFALYPPGEKKHTPGNELANVEITKVRPTESVLKVVDNAPIIKVREAARAFETLHNYGSVLKVAVKDVKDSEKLKSVFEKLGLTEKIGNEDESKDVLIRRPTDEDKNDTTLKLGKDFQGFLFQRKDGTIFAKVPESDKELDEVQKVLLNEAKRQTIKTIQDNDSSIKIEIRMISLETPDFEEDENGNVTKLNNTPKDKTSSIPINRGGQTEIKEKEWFRLEVKNVGVENAYITILDLQSDGKVAAVFPSAFGDNLIEKSTDWKKIPGYLRATKPFGQESFRVIGTRTPTDFSPLIVEPTEAENAVGRGESLTSTIRRLIDEQKKKGEVRGSDEENRKAIERVNNAIESPLGKLLLGAQEGKRSDFALPPAWSVSTVTFFVVR